MAGTEEKQAFEPWWEAILSQIGPQYALTGPFTPISQHAALLDVESRLRFNSLHAVDTFGGVLEFADARGRRWRCEAEWYRWHSDNVIEIIETRLTQS